MLKQYYGKLILSIYDFYVKFTMPVYTVLALNMDEESEVCPFYLVNLFYFIREITHVSH